MLTPLLQGFLSGPRGFGSGPRRCRASFPEFLYHRRLAMMYRSRGEPAIDVLNPFVAVILICLSTVPASACNETTAADVLSTGVESELACLTGWQEDIARSALKDQVGKTAYVKTLCRRRR
jgi:hypothetical protein